MQRYFVAHAGMHVRMCVRYVTRARDRAEPRAGLAKIRSAIDPCMEGMVAGCDFFTKLAFSNSGKIAGQQARKLGASKK